MNSVVTSVSKRTEGFVIVDGVVRVVCLEQVIVDRVFGQVFFEFVLSKEWKIDFMRRENRYWHLLASDE